MSEKEETEVGQKHTSSSGKINVSTWIFERETDLITETLLKLHTTCFHGLPFLFISSSLAEPLAVAAEAETYREETYRPTIENTQKSKLCY